MNEILKVPETCYQLSWDKRTVFLPEDSLSFTKVQSYTPLHFEGYKLYFMWYFGILSRRKTPLKFYLLICLKKS